MTNEVFSFPRFWKYFLYDIKQMWRNHAKAAILIGFSPVILYVITITLGMVFENVWEAPILPLRLILLCVAFVVLELYQTRTYGYLTERKAGSAWLMVPASSVEKTVSMVLMTILVIPVLFFAVFLLTDGLLTLLDPTYTDAILTSGAEGYQNLLDSMNSLNSEGFHFSVNAMLFPMFLSMCANFLYFMLCGICFKKYKIIGAFAIMMVLSFLIPVIIGLLPHDWILHWVGDINLDEEQVAHFMNAIMNWFTALVGVLAAGLAVGTWYRVKTLKH